MKLFSTHDDMEWIELGNGQRRKIRSYNKDIMLVEVGFDEGGIGALHTHPHAQISYVLSGEFDYVIEDQAWRMGPGDSIVIDGGKKHGLTCVKAGTLLDIFTPMREDFVK